MLGRLLLVTLIGASPWGGLFVPVGAGVALGVSVPATVACGAVGQFAGTLGVLWGVAQARRSPRIARILARLQRPRLSRLMGRFGLLGVPVGLFLLGAYAVAATLAVLGVPRWRIIASVGASLLLFAVLFAAGISLAIR